MNFLILCRFVAVIHYHSYDGHCPLSVTNAYDSKSRVPLSNIFQRDWKNGNRTRTKMASTPKSKFPPIITTYYEEYDANILAGVCVFETC
jgi:hypothetical protein